MKNQYYQQIRGLCIILVVMIHLPLGLDTGVSSFLWTGIRQIINFPVATFVFLSAYFCKYDSRMLVKDFYIKRLKRLLIPYFWGAVLYLVLLPYIREHHLGEDAVFRFLTGYGPAYFLLALAQLTIITPLIFKYKGSKMFRIISWLITPTYLVLYYVVLLFYGKEIPASQTPFFAWYVFYFIGIVYREDILRFGKKLGKVTMCFFIVVALILSSIESYLVLNYSGVYSFAISQIKMSSIIYSLIVIVYFVCNAEDTEGNWLSKLGDYSMGIFMLHPFFNWLFKFVLIHLNLLDYNSFPGVTFNHLVICLCSIVCSFCTSFYANKYYPNVAKTLGLV